MCGIAGIIYRNGAQPHPIGRDMTRMLQSMKHRGPDSTGYALYGPTSNLVVMRYKLADANDPRDFDFHSTQDTLYDEVEIERLGVRDTPHLWPMVALELQGQRNAVTLFGAVLALWNEDRLALSAAVFLTTIAAPLAEAAAMLATVRGLSAHAHGRATSSRWVVQNWP